ncbi:glycosyltransferase family 2 protein [Winogradskyella epiphytica]|nr:glycosyltransferase family 2 protein [Winogradskyella epiphytica]
MISVIIPIYNGAPFIENAYKTLIDQNIGVLEIIFVDNNSLDNSVAIITSIQAKDDRVRLYREPVQGAASARNAGLEQAKGEFVYFFDVDDELFENALNSLLEVLKIDSSLDSVHGNTIKSNMKLRETKVSLKDTYKLTVPEYHYWGIRWMNYGTLPGTPSFLHRRSVFDKIGCFNPLLKLGEDAAFHVKLGMECKVAHLDKKILLYYRHDSSTVSAQNKKALSREFTYWEPLIHEHIPYLLENEVPLAFKKEVLIRAYGYIPKMLSVTVGYSQRKLLKKKLLKDIQPLGIPVITSLFIHLTIVTGSRNLYKFYAYYVLKYYMRYIVK